MAEQSDPHFAPASLLIMAPRLSIDILERENLLQKHKEYKDNTSKHLFSQVE